MADVAIRRVVCLFCLHYQVTRIFVAVGVKVSLLKRSCFCCIMYFEFLKSVILPLSRRQLTKLVMPL